MMSEMRFLKGKFKKRLLSLLSKSRFDASCIEMPWELALELIGTPVEWNDGHLRDLDEKLFHSKELDESRMQRLVSFIMSYKTGRPEVDDEFAVVLFKHFCQHPARTDLIFYPKDHFEQEPSVADVVRKALGR